MYDNSYGAAEAPSNNVDIPDGKYQMRVERAECKMSKKTNRPMFVLELKIINRDFNGRCVWKNFMLDSETSYPWIKKDLDTLCIPMDKISDLPEMMNAFLDIEVEVALVTKGDNQSIYLNQRLGNIPSMTAKKNGKKKAAPKPAPVKEQEADDLPF